MVFTKKSKIFLTLLCWAVLIASVSIVNPKEAKALTCEGCTTICSIYIRVDHERLRPAINEHTSSKFTENRNWLLNDFFKGQILPALMLFTEQMSAVAMHQTMAIGGFFDAKQQLETQRLLQELQVEAHKDYQPSEDFCWFGTNVRSLAASEQRGRINAYKLSRRQMARHVAQENIGGGNDAEEDKRARWEMFQDNFCDPKDNNWKSSVAGSGLQNVCTGSPGVLANADIDYTRLVESQRSILLNTALTSDPEEVNLNAGVGSITAAEKAIFALGNNLYGHDVLTSETKDQTLKTDAEYKKYMELRTVTAKRSVAENSYNAIVGMKSAGSAVDGGSPDTYKYLGAILLELGMPDTEIKNMIGKRPSYYAQLELMAKSIYQSPNFYANAYDTPANIKRKRVALKAIELMVDRAIYESQTRKEMLASVLLSTRLQTSFRDVQEKLGNVE